MKNIITYINEYGKYSFQQRPFCHVDSLVLAELSYLKYDECASPVEEKQNHITLRKIAHLPKQILDGLFKGLMDKESNRELLMTAAFSKRFGNTKVSYYENLVEPENETQFAAMVFFIEKHYPFVAYRGTDETLAGWKEDFNMTYMSPVPAQERALSYLERVESALLERAPGFWMGGHSKGGNLAVYAAMKCSSLVQSHIIKVFNLDGPGFMEDVYQEKGYTSIAERIIKLIPQSSIIGMLLEKQTNYKIIKSSQEGILQHDPFTWIVEGGHFIYLKELDTKAQIMGKTLYQWSLEMSEEERKRLIELLFQMLSNEKLTPLVLFSEDWKKTGKIVLDAMKEVDEETRKFVWDIVLQLIKIGTQKIFDIENE